MTAVFVLGRIIFGGFFLNSAYGHFKNTSALAGYAGSKGVPNPKAAVIFSGILLVLGGLSIILGVWPGLGILALLLFLVPTTYMMHPFWKEADPMQKMGDRINFFKNLALIGALLMLTLDIPHWPAMLLG